MLPCIYRIEDSTTNLVGAPARCGLGGGQSALAGAAPRLPSLGPEQLRGPALPELEFSQGRAMGTSWDSPRAGPALRDPAWVALATVRARDAGQSSRCKGNRLRRSSCLRVGGARFYDGKYLGIDRSIPRL
jgi:hypothetical protein